MLKIIQASALIIALLPSVTLAQDFDAGLQAYEAEDYETALKEIRPLAEQGHSAAQYLLGRMYSAGNDVPQGNGETVPPWRTRNREKGHPWFRKAAEQGYADAQFEIGMTYYLFHDLTESVDEDVGEAMRWFRKAGDQGHVLAQAALAQIYYNGFINLSGGSTPMYRPAFDWRRKAAEQGHTYSQFHLGRMYYEGKGTPQNYAKAGRWLLKAAKQGSRDAQALLGRMYSAGKGVDHGFRGYFD